MTTTRLSLVAGVAGACLGLAGCCTAVCDAETDLKTWIALQYENCCGQDAPAWDSGLEALGDDYNELFALLMVADSACRNSNADLRREILQSFYDKLTTTAAPGLADGTVVRDGARIANLFPALGFDESISVALRSATPTTPLAPDPANATDCVADSLPEARPSDASPLVTRYQFAPGGRVVLGAGAFNRAHTLRHGELAVAQPDDDGVARTVPVSFKLEFSGNGILTTLTLDPACPFNEVVYADAASGELRMGVRLESDSVYMDRLEWLGTLWMVLPFTIAADGSMTVSTGGLVAGPTVFPVTQQTQAVLLNDPDANPPPLPNNREETCADVNGNGIRDGADEMNNLFSAYRDCDD